MKFNIKKNISKTLNKGEININIEVPVNYTQAQELINYIN